MTAWTTENCPHPSGQTSTRASYTESSGICTDSLAMTGLTPVSPATAAVMSLISPASLLASGSLVRSIAWSTRAMVAPIVSC
jgi:hypothetical protein